MWNSPKGRQLHRVHLSLEMKPNNLKYPARYVVRTLPNSMTCEQFTDILASWNYTCPKDYTLTYYVQGNQLYISVPLLCCSSLPYSSGYLVLPNKGVADRIVESWKKYGAENLKSRCAHVVTTRCKLYIPCSESSNSGSPQDTKWKSS